MDSALDKISQRFKGLDDWHHLNKFSLILVVAIFGAIPVTVFGAIALRQVSPQAATGKPTSLTPAYSATSTTPTFRWDCYCYTTKYRVFLREGDGNFYAGSWYKDVTKGSSNISSTGYSGFLNNNYKPSPPALPEGKTYYWTVSCLTGGCTTSNTQAFTVVDKTPPILTIKAAKVGPNEITWIWSATDVGGVSGYSYCYTDSVDPKYYKDVTSGGGGGGSSSTSCSPMSATEVLFLTNLKDDTLYNIVVTAYDTANNKKETSYSTRTLKIDSDGDTFGDAAEIHMGTGTYASCSSWVGTSSRPPDLNNDNKIDSVDQLILSKYVGTAYNTSLNSSGKYYTKRYDLNLDGYINSTDVSILTGFYGKTCIPN